MKRSFEKLLENHSRSDSKLTVRTFTTHDDPKETYALLEGDKKALKFLADLIYEHLASDACNFSMHLKSAGSAHLNRQSSVGLYIHRLPCELHPRNKVR